MRMSSQLPGKKVRWLKLVGVVLILLLHFLSRAQSLVDKNLNSNNDNRRISLSRGRGEENAQSGFPKQRGKDRSAGGAKQNKGPPKRQRKKKGKNQGNDDATTTPIPQKKIVLAVVVPWYGLLQKTMRDIVTSSIANINDAVPTAKDGFYLKPETIAAYRFGVVQVVLKNYTPKEILDALCNKVFMHNVNAILVVNNKPLSDTSVPTPQYLNRLANNLGLPILSWNSGNPGLGQKNSDSLMLQMAPSFEHQCRAMLTILDSYKWCKFSVITSTMGGHDNFIQAMRNTVNEGSEDYKDCDEGFDILTTISIEADRDDRMPMIKDHLKTIDKDTRIILFYASREEAKRIFTGANELNMTGKEYQWIVTQSTISDDDVTVVPKSFPVGLLGIHYDKSNQAMFKELRAGIYTWAKGVQNFNFTNYPKKPYPKKLFSCKDDASENGAIKWRDGERFYDSIRNVSFTFTHDPNNKVSDNKTVDFNEDGTVRSVDLSIINLNRERTWENIGEFRGNYLEIKDIVWPGGSRTHPKGRPERYQLTIVTLKEEPYVFLKYMDPKLDRCPSVNDKPCYVPRLTNVSDISASLQNGTDMKGSNFTEDMYCCSGFCIDLLKKLAEEIGFDFKLYQVQDQKWGSKNDKGEWNGLIKDLVVGKADMAVTSLKITTERSQAIDFSIPILETGITIVVLIKEGNISATAFLEPFELTSWILILVVCVHAVGVAMLLYEWLSPHGYNLHGQPPRGHRFSFFRALWLIWSMLFKAAVNVNFPKGMAARYLTMVWALFAVVFLASYTANLAAFMIAKEEFWKLTGIRDRRLVEAATQNPPFLYTTVRDGATEATLAKNYPEMNDYMNPHKTEDVTAGLQKLKDKEVDAFIYDSTVLEYRAGQDEGCELRTVGNWYAMTGYGLGFPPGSKWKPIMDKTLHKLSYNGVMERLQKFWLKGACKKDHEMDSSHPLGARNFTSAFILLGVGMVIGIALLFMEHCFFRFLRPQLRRWDRTGLCGLISMNMGRSLSFHSAVVETMEHMRHYKHCRNPMCDTQLWRAKHELDLALLKCERLEGELDTRKKEAMEVGVMMGMDTGPFSQHEAIEGVRYRGGPPSGGPPSGGPSHVPASHNAANASDNHDKYPLESFGTNSARGMESTQDPPQLDMKRSIANRTTPQHSVDQCRDGVANAPILPNKSQRLMQKVPPAGIQHTSSTISAISSSSAASVALTGVSPESHVQVGTFSPLVSPVSSQSKRLNNQHSHISKSPSPKDRRRWEDFPASTPSHGGGGGGVVVVSSSGDASRRRHPTGARISEGVILHGRGGASGGGGGGVVSGPDSPFSTLRHGSQASEDLPWGSSPPSQSSEPIESSKTDLDGIYGKNYRGRRVSRDRLARDLSVGRNGASAELPAPPSGPILRKRSKKRRQGGAARGLSVEQEDAFYGEEETTATATGTESDSGGRDSESEEEEDEELYGEADDDEEMLANKVVDKFLAGPIAQATSQSIQDLLVSGHVQMTRRQRYISHSRVDLTVGSPLKKTFKFTGSEPNLHKQNQPVSPGPSSSRGHRQESFESPSRYRHSQQQQQHQELQSPKNFRGQETRPHNPIVKYLPSRNADSMSSKESYGAEPGRHGGTCQGGLLGHPAQQGVAKPTPRHVPQSPFHNTAPASSVMMPSEGASSSPMHFPPPLQTSVSSSQLIKFNKSRGPPVPINPNPMLPRSSGSGGATRGGDPPFTLLDMEWRRGPNGDSNQHNSDWEKKKKVEIEREKKRNPMPKRKKRRSSQSPLRTRTSAGIMSQQGSSGVGMSASSMDAGSETDDLAVGGRAHHGNPEQQQQQPAQRGKKTYKNGHCYYELSTRGF